MTNLFRDIPISEFDTPCDRLVAEWNLMAEKAGIPKVLKLTPKRRAKLRRRWSELAFRAGWQRILRTIPTQGWMCGKGHVGRWKCTLDYVIRSEDTYIPILEKPDPGVMPVDTDEARRAEARAARG